MSSLLHCLAILILLLNEANAAYASTLPGFTSPNYGADSYPEGLPPEIRKSGWRMIPPNTILQAVALASFQFARTKCAFEKDIPNRAIYLQRWRNFILNMRMSIKIDSHDQGIYSETDIRKFVGRDVLHDPNTKRFATSLGKYLDKNTCKVKKGREESFRLFYTRCYANYLDPLPEDDKIKPGEFMSHNKWCSIHQSGESFKNYIHLFEQ